MVIPFKFIIMPYSMPKTTEEEKMECSLLASGKIIFLMQQVTLHLRVM